MRIIKQRNHTTRQFDNQTGTAANQIV